jgi:NUMOD3 motif
VKPKANKPVVDQDVKRQPHLNQIPKYLIYGLVDPRSLLIRYIGRSSNKLERAKRHLNKSELDTNTRCATWLKSLLTAGRTCELVVLESVPSPDCLNKAECWWIAYGKMSGWPLTNHTLGGEGVLGYRPSLKSRASRSKKLQGRIFSEEHRAKISETKRGVPKSKKHKQRLSASVKAAWQNEELRQRQRTAHLGYRHTPEQTAKIVAANKGRKRSAKALANMAAGQRKYNERLRALGIEHPLTGRTRAPEICAKIAKALRRRKRRVSKKRRGRR